MSKVQRLAARKIAMTQIFSKDGLVIPVSVVLLEPNLVIAEKKIDRNGYNALVLAAFQGKKKRISKPRAALFPSDALYTHVFESHGFEGRKIGDAIGIEAFESVNFVDVTGKSKGRGFQGVMKRHGAHGGPARVGSKFHRHIGSTGQSATPSRVRKGTKGAGRMGNATVTVLNLKIIEINKEQNCLLLSGSVPGSYKSVVYISPSVKKPIFAGGTDAV